MGRNPGPHITTPQEQLAYDRQVAERAAGSLPAADGTTQDNPSQTLAAADTQQTTQTASNVANAAGSAASAGASSQPDQTSEGRTPGQGA